MRAGLVLVLLVLPVGERAGAEEPEYHLAVHVDVGRGLKLVADDLTEAVAAKLGEYPGVIVIPGKKVQLSIANSRGETNRECRAGRLDPSCQISLGKDLGAAYWFEVSIKQAGQVCTVSSSCISITRAAQEAAALETGPCEAEAVIQRTMDGIAKVAAKMSWAPGVQPNDPLARRRARFEAAKTAAAEETARAQAERKRHLADARRDFADLEKAARDPGAPLDVRVRLVDSFLDTYQDTPEAERAGRLRAAVEATGRAELEVAERLAARASKNEPTSAMVAVPPGEAWIGCNEKIDSECTANERPGKLTFVGAVRIDRTEVTVAAYQRCVGAGSCTAAGSEPGCNAAQVAHDDHPVNCVDANQAERYCRWLGKRLPTELEWEKAARGTGGAKFPWGNEATSCGRANVSGCGEGTKAVATLTAGVSPYGAFDMAGNVAEWVISARDGTIQLRGGAFELPGRYARASYRMQINQGSHFAYAGFRCAIGP